MPYLHMVGYALRGRGAMCTSLPIHLLRRGAGVEYNPKGAGRPWRYKLGARTVVSTDVREAYNIHKYAINYRYDHPTNERLLYISGNGVDEYLC